MSDPAVRIDTGGSTPKASADRKITFLAAGAEETRTNDVLNVVDRVRYTSVLCYALISKIDLSVLIKCNVLKKSVTI